MTRPVKRPWARARGFRPARLALAGLLTLPLLELAVLLLVGQAIGATLTVLLTLLLVLIGILVLRLSGRQALRGLSRPGPAGAPAADLASARDTAWGLLGGLLLVVPGFVTAVPGLLLAFPPTRRLLAPVLGRGAGRLAARLLGEPLVCRMAGTEPRVVPGDTVDATTVEATVVDPGPAQDRPKTAPELTDRSEPDRRYGTDPPDAP